MEKIIIVDFGSQYTQLIARRIRELNVYCEIEPYTHKFELDSSIKGIVLSGGPASVNENNAPDFDFMQYQSKIPVLGICYGAQLIAKKLGGTVGKSSTREYGRAKLSNFENKNLFENLESTQVWMSHSDTIKVLPEGFSITAGTENIEVAAFEHDSENTFGIQFHPEVHHSTDGKHILENFVINICACSASWTPANFVEQTVSELKEKISDDQVVLGLSGGVDSTVAAVLLQKAIGTNLHCIFVNNGLLRKNEADEVLENYKTLGLNIHYTDVSDKFLSALENVKEPEQKRKIIGRIFIEVFDEEAHKIQNITYLGQGTIYPDVIESVSVKGPSATIKSHHNVGGLPEKMHLKIVEPLRSLFKDEVRRVGKSLEISPTLLGRHPFPGPGLAIRIIGEITRERIQILQEADNIFINGLREHELYDKVWQAFAVYLPVESVGVMGDERTYENVVALRAVSSVDGMTADWAHLPHEFLAEISNKIINQVKGINRVVYDISSKPPATIEWE